MFIILLICILLNCVTCQNLISKGKPTSQTSTEADTFAASMCVDGRQDTRCNTVLSDSPSWIVDLEAEYSINSIVLYNRQDCCMEKLIGAEVELLSQSGDIIYSCGTINEGRFMYTFICGNNNAYKVRVKHTKNEVLHFSELEVYGDNPQFSRQLLSLGKPTTMGSNYYPNYGPICVDGLTDNFCHSMLEGAYFIVDLQGAFRINSIVLYNRVDCCSERIVGTVIELLGKNDEPTYVCGVITENKPMYNFACNNNYAYKVQVRQSIKQFLHFTELSVYGDSVILPRNIISKDKPVSQGSTFSDANQASVCIDGKTDNFCQTLTEDPSWTLDLQGQYTINRIVLHNRVDCCSEKLVGASIQLILKNNDPFYICGFITESKPIYHFYCNNYLATKIRVKHLGNEVLHFTELEVTGGTINSTSSLSNIISLGRPTFSASKESPGHSSDVCVDGKTDNYCEALTEKPFWMVDLEDEYFINYIVLQNRIDCCSEKIVGAVIELLSINDNLIFTCGEIKESKETYEFNCKKYANKVRVRHKKDEALHFTELTVVGGLYKI